MDRDELRTCPYDKGHQVRSSRFEIHLIKCKRNNEMRIQKKITVDICPFNVKHQYTKDEMRVHLRDCPDKFRLMTEKIYMELPPPEPVVEIPAAFENEEEWGAEIGPSKPSEPRINPAYSYSRLSKKDRKEFNLQLIKDFKAKQNEKSKAASNASDKGFYSNQQSI